VAIWSIQISQGSELTHLRRGGNFCNRYILYFITNPIL